MFLKDACHAVLLHGQHGYSKVPTYLPCHSHIRAQAWLENTLYPQIQNTCSRDRLRSRRFCSNHQQPCKVEGKEKSLRQRKRRGQEVSKRTGGSASGGFKMLTVTKAGSFSQRVSSIGVPVRSTTAHCWKILPQSALTVTLDTCVERRHKITSKKQRQRQRRIYLEDTPNSRDLWPVVSVTPLITNLRTTLSLI